MNYFDSILFLIIRKYSVFLIFLIIIHTEEYHAVLKDSPASLKMISCFLSVQEILTKTNCNSIHFWSV